MKLDIRDAMNLLLFIVVGILLFILVFKIGSDGAQCTLNPLEFGASQLRGANNNEEIMCSCSLLTEHPSPTLHFNHNSSRFERPTESLSSEFANINFTGFKDLIVLPN